MENVWSENKTELVIQSWFPQPRVNHLKHNDLQMLFVLPLFYQNLVPETQVSFYCLSNLFKHAFYKLMFTTLNRNYVIIIFT